MSRGDLIETMRSPLLDGLEISPSEVPADMSERSARNTQGLYSADFDYSELTKALHNALEAILREHAIVPKDQLSLLHSDISDKAQELYESVHDGPVPIDDLITQTMSPPRNDGLQYAALPGQIEIGNCLLLRRWAARIQTMMEGASNEPDADHHEASV